MAARMPPEIEDDGFSVVSDAEGANAVVDIIFVHGLQGHPRDTFSTIPSLERADHLNKKSKNILKWFGKPSEQPGISSDEATSSKGKIFWPFDFLAADPRFSGARILTWGYNSNVTEVWKAVSHENISRLGQNFLVGLQQVRKKNPDRPLIFVAHSLGGLLVKIALVRSRGSKNRPQFLPIYPSTIGIIFLGTPQSGSGAADWGLLASNISFFALRSRNTNVLQGLTPNNELLENLSEDFLQLLGDDDPKISFHSFYETKGLSGFVGISGEVVPRKYAVIDHLRETAVGIDGDHSEVCKFGSKSNAGYKAVVGALEDYVEDAKKRKRQGDYGNAAPPPAPLAPGAHNPEATQHFAAHYGNNESGGVGIYGESNFFGSTTIGGVQRNS